MLACPPTTSAIAGAPPLYCTVTASIFARFLNISPMRSDGTPMPPEASTNLPGILRPASISSRTLVAGTDGCTHRTRKVGAIIVTGTRSRAASYGIFANSHWFTTMGPGLVVSSV